MSLVDNFIDGVPELMAKLSAADADAKEYFIKGAETLLEGSTVDPKLALGAILWAYMDLLQQLDVRAHIEEAIRRIETPPKGELN